MNSTMMVSNLIILSNSMSSDGSGGLPFPHAWAALIWFTITVVVFICISIPWMEWTSEMYDKPTNDWMREHNAKYHGKLLALVGSWILISILSAVIPLCMGL